MAVSHAGVRLVFIPCRQVIVANCHQFERLKGGEVLFSTRYSYFGYLPLLTLFLSINIVSADEPVLLSHSGTVQSLAFSPTAPNLLASAGEDIKLWDLRDGSVTTLIGHTDAVNAIAFSPNGQTLASGSLDRQCRIWNVQSRDTITTLEHFISGEGSYTITDVAFSSDGRLLATANRGVKLWDTAAWQEIVTFHADPWIHCVAFSHDSQLLAAGDRSGYVRIWNIEARQLVTEMKIDPNSVYGVAFSPDDTILASAGQGGEIKLLSTVDWERIGTLHNLGTVFDLAFTADGQTLASTGYERISLWSVRTGKDIVKFREHAGWVRTIALSPDGSAVGSGGDDGIVRVQDISAYLQQELQENIVRLFYFIPTDQVAQKGMDDMMDIMIKEVQQFYAEQMRHHGFGRKTFAFETDSSGNAIVHHVNGQFDEKYYYSDAWTKVWGEVKAQLGFDLSQNIYFSVMEASDEIVPKLCGRGGSVRGRSGNVIVTTPYPCSLPFVAAHELGHAFGLQHDFRDPDDIYIMSYGGRDWNKNQLSKCAAEWLNVSRFFNRGHTYFDEPATLEMLPPLAYPSNAIGIRFDLTDLDLLYQAQLLIPATAEDLVGGVKLYGCKSLKVESGRIEFFVPDPRGIIGNEIQLQVIDMMGNITIETDVINRGDGLLLKPDVNADGVVDVFDLVLVARFFEHGDGSGDISDVDVNRDGVINVNDLILVANAIN